MSRTVISITLFAWLALLAISSGPALAQPPSAPRIDSITYDNGPVPTGEDRLLIRGANFPADPTVTFAGEPLVVLAATDTEITITGVPLGGDLPPGMYRVEVQGRSRSAADSADFHIGLWKSSPGTVGPIFARATNGGPVGAFINGALNVSGPANIDFVNTRAAVVGPHPQGGTAFRVNGNAETSGSLLACGGVFAPNFLLATCPALSDFRLKKEIRPLEGALAKVLALRGVSYEWRREEFPLHKFPSGRQDGFIAQEVEAIVPEVVWENHEGMKLLATQNLAALLVEGMKEQQLTIERQRAEINGLSARIAELAAVLAKMAIDRGGAGRGK